MKTHTKSFVYVVLALLAVLSFLAVWGCAGQTREANRLIDKFNARINKHNKLDRETTELMNTLNTKAKTAEEFKENVEILEEVEDRITQQQEELSKATELLKEAKTLSISADFKTYIEMEQKANEANRELFKTTKKLTSELKNLYEDMSSVSGLSQAQLDERTKAITGLSDEITAEKEEAEKLKKEANNYYKEHNLGK